MIILGREQLADTPEAWPVVGTEVLASGAVVELVEDQIQTPDGELIKREYLAHPGAVGIIALDDHDRVVLVRQYRYALDHESWEIPEGGVPREELALEGARRELSEEAGIEADTWRELCRVHVSNSITDEVATLFLATGLRVVAQALEASEADLVVEWVPFATALAMVLDGRITDALSVIALQRVAIDRAR